MATEFKDCQKDTNCTILYEFNKLFIFCFEHIQGEVQLKISTHKNIEISH